MKPIKQKLGVLLILLTGFGVASCDFSGLSNAVDDFKVVVGLDPINTSSAVLLTDAATGELITANVEVIFEGENGDDVIDIYSDPISEKEVSSGILTFGISNNVVPTEESPVSVRIRLRADG